MSDDALSAFQAGDSLPDPLPPEPMTLARAWFDRAVAEKVQPNPDAMTLATVDEQGRPSARIVLCKEIDAARGCAVFYTNYEGRKGRELASNPRAALLLHWDALDRQVRIEGPAVRTTPAESDAYFATRTWDRQVGAWASEQSRPIASREALMERVAETIVRLRLDPLDLMEHPERLRIPRPPHWGGFRVWGERVELWVGGSGRIHDRAEWTRTLTARDGFTFDAGAWSATRLQP